MKMLINRNALSLCSEAAFLLRLGMTTKPILPKLYCWGLHPLGSQLLRRIKPTLAGSEIKQVVLAFEIKGMLKTSDSGGG